MLPVKRLQQRLAENVRLRLASVQTGVIDQRVHVLRLQQYSVTAHAALVLVLLNLQRVAVQFQNAAHQRHNVQFWHVTRALRLNNALRRKTNVGVLEQQKIAKRDPPCLETMTMRQKNCHDHRVYRLQRLGVSQLVRLNFQV